MSFDSVFLLMVFFCLRWNATRFVLRMTWWLLNGSSWRRFAGSSRCLTRESARSLSQSDEWAPCLTESPLWLITTRFVCLYNVPWTSVVFWTFFVLGLLRVWFRRNKVLCWIQIQTKVKRWIQTLAPVSLRMLIIISVIVYADACRAEECDCESFQLVEALVRILPDRQPIDVLNKADWICIEAMYNWVRGSMDFRVF